MNETIERLKRNVELRGKNSRIRTMMIDRQVEAMTKMMTMANHQRGNLHQNPENEKKLWMSILQISNQISH